MSVPINQLLQILSERYNTDEFKTLCLTLDIYYPELRVNFDNLGGEGLQGKARELILQVRRYNNIQGLEKLAAVVASEHPDFLQYVPADLRIASAVPAGGGHTAASPTTNPMSTNTPSAVSTPQKEFINFDLRIYPKQGDKYGVEASHNHSGGAGTGTIYQTFNLADPQLKDLFLYLQELVAEKNDAKQFGQKLRDLLFPSQTWTLFNTLRQEARREGKGVRLRLRIDPPELSRLPWEYCYDEESRLFFAQDLTTPVVRYFQRPYTPDTLATSGPLKILMVMADPTNLPRLDMAKEETTLRRVLADKLTSGQVALEVVANTTAYKLQRKVSEMEPHVLHFVGHGEFSNGEGALVLEDENQQAQRLTAEQLSNLLRHRGVRLVVLNACQTAAGDEGDAFMSVAPALVLADIPAVIAMQFNVPDTMAIRYTQALYDYLALYKPLDLAVTEMRISAASGPAPEDQVLWGIPVLFMRAPDGVIWQRPNTAASSPTSGGGAAAAHQPAASPTTVVNDNSKTNTKMTADNINFNVGGNYIAGNSTGGNVYNAQGDINIGGKEESAQPTVSLPDLYAQIEAAVPALIPQLDEYDREDLPNYIADGRKELDRQRLPKVAKELKDARDIVRKHKATAADLLAKIDQAIALADK
ncbi:MAG: CHAT domain-containing protein [Chloroflexi bacterium]|nr:CHAT domain-containing protein [Chloroflexota bacterium]